MPIERKQVASRSPALVNRFCFPGTEPMTEVFRPAPQRADGARGRADQRRAFLTAAIEGEIIPQLAFGLRQAPREERSTREAQSTRDARSNGARKRAPADSTFDPAAVEQFARLILNAEIATARAHLDRIIEGGREIEAVYLELLGPAARHLGVMWEQDSCTFVDVTIGLARLHRLMRDYLPGFHKDAPDASNGLSVLLAPAPGEQHTFGLSLVAEFFRRAGWDVESNVAASDREIGRTVAKRSISVIGFSTSCTDRLDSLAESISAARRNSRNPGIAVIVGGHVFLQDPQLVARIGADAMVTDGHQAPLQAQLLVSRLLQQARR